MINHDQLTPKIIDYARFRKIDAKLFWGMVWSISTIVFASIQVLLGADQKIVFMAFISLLCCIVPLILFGIYDIGAVFIFILLSKYSFFPLWIKTILGERIDIGLTSPFNTFAIALAGSMIGCLALLLAKIIPVRKRVFHFALTDEQTTFAGYLASIFGLIFLTLHVFFGSIMLSTGELIQGYGGFGSLIGALYFGIVCLTAVGMKSKSNPVHRVLLALIFLWILFLSLRSNAKIYLTFSVFAFLLTIFYFSFKIKKRYYIYLCILVAFYTFIFAPVLHLTRNSSFQLANISGKISILENLLKSTSIQDLVGESNKIYNLSYYPSSVTFLFDRFEMIRDLDIAAGGITSRNTIGWIPFLWAGETSLPGFIFPNKPQVNDIDLIAYNAGYFPILTRLNHTIGIFGSAYAMFLWPSLIFVSLPILTIFILILRIIVLPNLKHNLFGIFFLASYSFNFSEQSVQSITSTMLRSLPLDSLLLLGILFLTFRIFPKSRTQNKH